MILALAPRLRHTAVILALLAAAAGSQVLVDQYRPVVNDEAGMQFSFAAVMVRSVVGEVRGLLADILWLRLDEYQHRRRLQNGAINREDDEALMPLARLITWLDPHFVDAYALGGQWLAFHFNMPREALQFYEEGIRNNPQSFDLQNGAAWVYWKFQRDYQTATRRAHGAASVAQDDLQRFRALWLEAHIREDAGDIAGAIRVWRQIGAIPGYDRTAVLWIKRLISAPPGGAKPAKDQTNPSPRIVTEPGVPQP